MKPILLKITGLNSFMSEQVIDFKTLTDKGLFGIFGPTGSGKSTILDAITIVLFGEIVRKNKDFMNTNCDSLSIGYEFEIGLGSSRKYYIAERNFRRDKNNNIKTKYARLMEKTEEEICMIAEKPTEVKKQIEKIIGLTLDDFTRSVVLPQGKFSEFLKLKGKEKRDMLERIFGLEKYGKQLGEKIKKARNKELKKQSQLEGALKRFENISEEGYQEKEEELKRLKEEEIKINEKKEKAQEDYEKYKNIWELQKEIKDYEEKWIVLNGQKEDMEKLKEKALRGDKALLVKPYIDEKLKTEEEIKKNDEALIDAKNKLENIKKQMEDTEKKYKEAVEQKDLFLPKYIQKEIDLKRAIEMKEDTDHLEKERGALLKQYKEKNEKKKNLTEKLMINEEKGKNIKEILKNQEKRVSEIKIDLSYREQIEKALEVEKDYNEQSKRINELKEKIKEKKISYESNKEEHQKILKLQKEKEDHLNKRIQKQKELEKNCPGNDDTLLKSQSQLNHLRIELDKGIENIKKRDVLKLDCEKIEKDRRILENILEQKNKEIEAMEKDQRALELEITQIERENASAILAKNLKESDPCPVCGSTHHVDLAVGVEENVLKEKKEEKEILERKIKDLDQNLRKVSSNFEYAKKEMSRFIEEIKPLDEILKEFNLERSKKDYKESQKAFESLKNSIDAWKKEKNELEEKLNKGKDEKNEIDRFAAELKIKVKTDQKDLEGLEKEFTEKDKDFKDLGTTYDQYREKLNIESFKNEMDRIKGIEKEIEKIQKSQKDLTLQIEVLEPETKKLNETINELNVNLQSIKDVGQEKRKYIDEKKKEMEKLIEGKDPSKYILEIQEKIKTLHDTVKKLNQQLEEEKKEKEDKTKEVTSKEQTKKNLIKNIENQILRLEKILKEHEFEKEEDVLIALITKEEIEKDHQKIKDYEDLVKNTKDNMDRIQKQLKNERMDEATWNKIVEDKKQYEVLLKEKHTQIGALDSILKQMKKDLEELKAFNKDYKKVEHQLSLLYDIEKLIQGNKFVEFVAMNQLKYIARVASKRLLSITGNRYALEIDDEGNFTVRDDKNGGVVRETSSLSGGETFLTSLALALSLSIQIQLKGSAPLEFFFLDEGFGTLDAYLLEVVMTSLEKLHTDQLSVGIISHVEELKNRVPVKLLVTPGDAGNTGSRVRLEYS
ncbi:MAG: AAA family ATPase [Marinisporobacter sp.]|jgi:exonuclease SbcC|nr:AAA family ATPase [Marinisporobacter sp.]